MEGLRGSDHPFTGRAFRAALRDADNRVVVNAAVGLYRMGDPEGIETLLRLIGDGMASHRISAAWALGETGDSRSEPVLARLLEDPNTAIRRVATEALEKVRTAASAAASAGRLDVDILSCSDQPGSWKRLVVAVADEDGAPLRTLAGSSFTILEDRVALTDVRFREPSRRDRLVLAYGLDCSTVLASEQIEQTAVAVVRSLQAMKSGDRCMVCKYADAVEPSQGFMGNPAQIRNAILKLYSGRIGTPRLYDAASVALDFVVTQRGTGALILLSDGSDGGSEMAPDDLVAKAVQAGVPIFGIGCGDGTNHDALRQLSARTQGECAVVERVEDLPDVCRRLFNKLSSVYAFTYKPIASGATTVRVEVQCDQGCGQASLETPGVELVAAEA